MKLKHLLFVGYLFISLPFFGQTVSKKVYFFEIDDNIAKPALRKTEKAIKEATAEKADILLLRLNTFGGELESADKIRTLLLEAPMTTIVFIDNNAASAGALISIACDSIYMAPGSSIGAASVVNQQGEIMPDKYQSYMRSLMRTTAEKKGRNPMIAQAMVDPDVYIKGIIDSGKVLTFTTKEAILNDFCEGEVNSLGEIMQNVGVENYDVSMQKLSFLDKIILFLVNPIVSGILIMLIVGGIYFELQTPGVGFPLIVAISAALLYFAPHYLEGLAAHWEILLFILGVGLLLVEIFLIPGFGFVGITGIVLIVASLILSMIFNIGFDFQLVPPTQILGKIFLVLSSVIIGFFLSIWVGKKVITTETRFGTLAFNTVLNSEEGYIAQDMRLADLIGRNGITITFMRPSGKVEIDGEIYDAVSDVGLIDKNEEVEVIKFENAQLVVTKKNKNI